MTLRLTRTGTSVEISVFFAPTPPTSSAHTWMSTQSGQAARPSGSTCLIRAARADQPKVPATPAGQPAACAGASSGRPATAATDTTSASAGRRELGAFPFAWQQPRRPGREHRSLCLNATADKGSVAQPAALSRFVHLGSERRSRRCVESADAWARDRRHPGGLSGWVGALDAWLAAAAGPAPSGRNGRPAPRTR